jgi:hypothetical protein
VGSQPVPSKANNKVALCILCVVVIGAGVFWFYQRSNATPEPDKVVAMGPLPTFGYKASAPPAESQVAPSARELRPLEITDTYETVFEGFKDNQAAATEKYKGRLLKLKGTVFAVTSFNVIVVGEASNPNQRLVFDVVVKDATRLGKLTPGEQIFGLGYVRAGAYINLTGPEVLIGIVDAKIL